MAITEYDDVEVGYESSIPSDKQTWVEDKIDEAELILEARLGDLSAWIAAGDAEARVKQIKMVVARMVRRVLRNPSGYAGESDGDYSYNRGKQSDPGDVVATRRDWSLLGLSRSRAPRSFRAYLPPDSPRNMTGNC